jgi:hypothetical protein
MCLVETVHEVSSREVVREISPTSMQTAYHMPPGCDRLDSANSAGSITFTMRYRITETYLHLPSVHVDLLNSADGNASGMRSRVTGMCEGQLRSHWPRPRTC